MSESVADADALPAQTLASSPDVNGFAPPATTSAERGTRTDRPAPLRRADLPALPARPAAVVAAVSGLALWLAFPGHDAWPLAPLGVAGLSLAVRGQRTRRSTWLGLLTGLAFTLPVLHWSGVYVGTLPWVALSVLEALYLAVLGAVLPWAWRAPGRGAGVVLATTGLWVAQEALRSRTPFGGFPWARLAFSQSDAPTLALASLGGAPLVSAAVAASGACLALAAVHALSAVRRGHRPHRPLLEAVGAVAAAVVLIGGGAVVPRPVDAARTLPVAAVQGNVPTAGLDFNAQRRAVLDNHATATLALARAVQAGAAPRPALVLWPENSSDIDPLRNVDAAEVIQSASDAIGAPVLVGAVLLAPPDHVANTTIVWGPTGSATPGPGERYAKRHPAPFAEYIPYRSFFRIFSDKVDLVTHDFVAGDEVGLLRPAGVPVGDIICFEVAYDDLVRDTVQAGAQLIVVQTNNATFGYTDESVQQLAMSRLRAVESGRAVVHISTVGVSALIGPDGRMLRTSGHFTQDVLQADLPLRTATTPATRLGGAPEAVLTALGMLLALAAGVRARRHRHRAAPGGEPRTPPRPSVPSEV